MTRTDPSPGAIHPLKRQFQAILIAGVFLSSWAGDVQAVLDIDDDGPVLDAGGFRLRVTNAGILGNAFLDVGRSYDPSLEFPPHSGNEMLNYAALWVGARDDRGRVRVSGGPLLEWRPSLADGDTVLFRQRGELGTRWRYDDDMDGRVDEELLNAIDDDGDGAIDEDLGFTADRMMAAQYRDDRPEAVNYTYGSGEIHEPLGLAVHQEVYAWSRPGFEKIAGMQFTITNVGTRPLEDVYIGLFADVDARDREDRTGHLNDRIQMQSFARDINEGLGINVITINGRVPSLFGGGPPPPAFCISALRRSTPTLVDGIRPESMPMVTILPLEHTTDPFAFISAASQYARAPGTVSFRTSVFSRDGQPGQGGVPRLDGERYAALQGNLLNSTLDRTDQVTLTSCGPFARIEPGQSIQFTAAILLAEDADTLAVVGSNALYLHHGMRANLEPDEQGSRRFPQTEYYRGRSGLNGHEACIQAPPGVTFNWDPHCVTKFPVDAQPFPPPESTYVDTRCIWTDADCDPCTGFDGKETVIRWLDPGQVPPVPETRVTPGDHVVEVAWNSTPEVLLRVGQYGTPLSRFLGYRIYRLGDWRQRKGLLPPLSSWSLVAAFGDDTLNSETSLSTVLDTTVASNGTILGEPVYPPGRYRFDDRTAQNGFDYVYAVTSVYELRRSGGPTGLELSTLESPIIATFADRVSPQASARGSASGVWVVPNPYRGAASWDRPSSFGDPLPRHIDFMGLPQARSKIKIWTVAGDLVAVIDHDGTLGDGEASWDLISRNGQEVESGIYLFTVESPLGESTGRFVLIR